MTGVFDWLSWQMLSPAAFATLPAALAQLSWWGLIGLALTWAAKYYTGILMCSLHTWNVRSFSPVLQGCAPVRLAVVVVCVYWGEGGGGTTYSHPSMIDAFLPVQWVQTSRGLLLQDMPVSPEHQ